MLYQLIDVTKRKPVRVEKSSIPENPILRAINLHVDGTVPQLILGPSGSGKSTLLRLFNRLSDPDEGVIHFRDKDISTYDVLSLRMRVGYVSQIPVMLGGTVRANLRYAVKHIIGHNHDDGVFDDECVSILRFLNVPELLLDRDAAELSVGEKQRVALARSLIRKPEVLLLDEPTSALDPTATARFLDVIQKLRDEMNISIIMVTHSIDQAKVIGGDVALLVNGGIVEQGRVEKITGEPENEITKKFIRGNLDN